MIAVTQTKVVVKNSDGKIVQNGNCFPAVVASILELPIHEVPNIEVFYELKYGYGKDVMNDFLGMKGYLMRCADEFKCFHEDLFGKKHDGEELRAELKDQYYLVSGESPRPGINHICIYQNGVMVHDPHPTREGVAFITDFQIIEPI